MHAECPADSEARNSQSDAGAQYHLARNPWDRVIKSYDGKVGFQFDANLRHQQVDTVIVAMVCDKNSALAQRYIL